MIDILWYFGLSFVLCVPLALFFGMYAVTFNQLYQSGELLNFEKRWVVNDRTPEWIQKALYDCPKCMAGNRALIGLIAMQFVVDFEPTNIIYSLMVIVMSIFFAHMFSK